MVRLLFLFLRQTRSHADAVDSCSLADISAETLAALKAALGEAGFAPYVTAVGGSGVGILHPEDRKAGASTDLAKHLQRTGVDELDGWALAQGRWGFA
jgi:hypothetical protein